MISSTSLFSRLWRKLFPAAVPSPLPMRLSSELRTRVRRNHLAERTVEPLEGRIAPATLLPGGKALSYTDVDGDEVTITFSKQLFQPTSSFPTNSLLQNVFIFSAGKAHTGVANAADDVPQLLQRIDLTKLQTSATANSASGVSFTITAHQVDANHDGVLEGDGLVNIGAINATSVTLGSVLVQGDLGQIDAGNSNSAVALVKLKVNSLGKLTNTQAGTANYESAIVGQLGTFVAKTVEGGYLHVTDGFSFSGTPVALGQIGMVKVTDYIKTRDLTTVATNDGRIEAARSIGSILIGDGTRDAAHPETSDGLTGGAGVNSGSIAAGTKIGSILIQGDLRGGGGATSASIVAPKTIGSIEINGTLLGAGGASSAYIHSGGDMGTVLVGRAQSNGLVGGSGSGSGVISSGGVMGAVRVSGILGSGPNSGGISAEGALTSLFVEESLQGGAGLHSGFVESYTSIGAVKIGANLLGSGGERSGTIVSSGAIGDIFVRSQVIGGAGPSSGGISSGISGTGSMGAVTISNSLVGGSGANSGLISSGGSIKTLAVTRSAQLGVEQDAILGGAGPGSGAVYAFGTLGTTVITGSVHGGAGDDSGTIRAHGLLASVAISRDVMGGVGAGSGSVVALDRTRADGTQVAGSFGAVTIGGIIMGGTGLRSGNISADGDIASLQTGGLFTGGDSTNGRIVAGAGVVGAGNIGTLSLGHLGTAPANVDNGGQIGGTVLALGTIGSIQAVELYDSVIHVGASLGSLTVSGSVAESTVTARGQAAPAAGVDLAIGSITIGGNVRASSVLAGYSVTSDAANGHAQIGAVKVKGSWFASNLVAGVRDPLGDGFGTADDRLITDDSTSTAVARIASVVIKGNVGGDMGATQYGFVAGEIGAFSVAGEALALTADPRQVVDLTTSGSTSHVTVREVGAVS